MKVEEQYTLPEGLAADNVANLADAPDQGRPYLPQQRYVLVCTKADFGKSKFSGNNMITLEWEVVDPKVVRFKNDDVKVEGISIIEFASLQPQALGRLKSLHTLLKLPMNVNLNAPDTNIYLGKALAAVVKTNSKTMNIEGTNEPILDPNTGKPIANNEYRVERYLCAEPTFNREIPY